jgi:hypothetical protein
MSTTDLQQKFGSVNLDKLKEQLGGKPPVEHPLGNPMGEPGRKQEPSRESVPPGSGGAEQPHAAAPNVPSAPPQVGEQGEREPFAQRLLNWADRLQRFDPSLRNSPALGQAIEGLSRYAGGEDQRWDKLANAARSAGDRISQWGRSLGLDRLPSQERLRWPRGLARPSMPNFHLPHIEAPFGNRTSPNIPHISPVSGSRDASGPVLAAAAALLLLAAIARRIWARSHRLRSVGTAPWRPGPWPVEPDAVATPQELVLAFEHLSVLRLGPAARNWNHRAIAESLGPAANELAHLYELARYAPPGDPLPAGALVSARRHLCLLAGIYAA